MLLRKRFSQLFSYVIHIVTFGHWYNKPLLPNFFITIPLFHTSYFSQSHMTLHFISFEAVYLVGKFSAQHLSALLSQRSAKNFRVNMSNAIKESLQRLRQAVLKSPLARESPEREPPLLKVETTTRRSGLDWTTERLSPTTAKERNDISSSSTRGRIIQR